MYFLVWLIFWALCAVVVSADAKSLGATRGALGGGVFDMGAGGWFFSVALLSPIAIVGYLVTRPQYVRRKEGEQQPRHGTVHTMPPQQQAYGYPVAAPALPIVSPDGRFWLHDGEWRPLPAPPAADV